MLQLEKELSDRKGGAHRMGLDKVELAQLINCNV
jgi:hypothetical protein